MLYLKIPCKLLPHCDPQVAAASNMAERRQLTVEALEQLSDTLNGQDLPCMAKKLIQECLQQQPNLQLTAGQLLESFRNCCKAVSPRAPGAAAVAPVAAETPAKAGAAAVAKQHLPAGVGAFKPSAVAGAAVGSFQGAARLPPSATPMGPPPPEPAKVPAAQADERGPDLVDGVAASSGQGSLLEMVCNTGETKQLSVAGKLGSGAFGQVYTVFDLELQRLYALKMSQNYSEYVAAVRKAKLGFPKQQQEFEADMVVSFQLEEQLLLKARQTTRYVVECYARGFVQQSGGIRQALLLELCDCTLQVAMVAPVKEGIARKRMEQVRCRAGLTRAYVCLAFTGAKESCMHIGVDMDVDEHVGIMSAVRT